MFDSINGEEAKKWIMSLEKFGSKPGLARIEWLLEQLGRPQNDLSIIHVAGTNGKGSTCHILESILSANNYQVGLFTSPFVDSFENKIVCGKSVITEEQLGRLSKKIKEFSKDSQELGLGHPTQFEVITVLAFLYYQEMNPDLVVLETGLGGGLDATNVVLPLIAIITNVGYDHIHVLGDNLEDIASEKAGIIKKGVPVVTGVTKHESAAVLEVISDKCDQTASTLYSRNKDFWANVVDKEQVTGKKTQLDEVKYLNTFDYHGLNTDLTNLKLSILGEEQVQNAGVSLCTLELLEKMDIINLNEEEIRVGLQGVNLPVRVEYWPGEKLNQDKKANCQYQYPDIIFDASHNPEAISSLMKSIKELRMIKNWDKIIYVIGILADKPVERCLDKISIVPDEFIVTTPENQRALSAVILSSYLQKRFSQSEITVEEKLSIAVDDGITKGITSLCDEQLQNIESTGNSRNLLVIWGSFYLAVTAREKLKYLR